MGLSDIRETRQGRGDDDGELVARARSGDLAAFERLVRNHQQRMFTIAFRITGGYEDACEIVQDTFVAAWRGLGTFRGAARFTTWLTAITVNLSRNRLDQIRTRWRNEPISLDEPRESADGFLPREAVSETPSAQEELERRDVRRHVQKCIAELAPGFREVLVLRDMEDFSYEEIGTMLSLSGGTVRSRLSRARDTVRECLKRVIGVL
jgi:RNA polymerase sigma-70 factor (ECF subfamily)